MHKPFQLPGLHLYEYLLVIELPAALRERVEQTREELAARFRIDQPPTGKPNVCLARFSAMKMTEEKIVKRLGAIANAEKPFTIELKDFGSYPMHAVFIRIANQQRVLQLIKNLKKARVLMKAGGEDPHFLQDPNIALAGRMEKDKYLEAIKEYERNSFSAHFTASSFLLIKRSKHEKKYEVVNRFGFQCLPVRSAQGVLFTG